MDIGQEPHAPILLCRPKPSLSASSSCGASTRTPVSPTLLGPAPESARRHIQAVTHTSTCVARICVVMHCSAEWLLLGRGPKSLDDAQLRLLEQARPSQLCRALGLALERMEQSLTLEIRSRRQLPCRALKQNPLVSAPPARTLKTSKGAR